MDKKQKVKKLRKAYYGETPERTRVSTLRRVLFALVVAILLLPLPASVMNDGELGGAPNEILDRILNYLDGRNNRTPRSISGPAVQAVQNRPSPMTISDLKGFQLSLASRSSIEAFESGARMPLALGLLGGFAFEGSEVMELAGMELSLLPGDLDLGLAPIAVAGTASASAAYLQEGTLENGMLASAFDLNGEYGQPSSRIDGRYPGGGSGGGGVSPPSRQEDPTEPTDEEGPSPVETPEPGSWTLLFLGVLFLVTLIWIRHLRSTPVR